MNGHSCLDCGYQFDACTDPFDTDSPIGAGKPAEGAWSLCIRCGAGAIFTGNGLELRPPTDDERLQIDAHPEVQRARRGLAVVRRSLPN